MKHDTAKVHQWQQLHWQVAAAAAVVVLVIASVLDYFQIMGGRAVYAAAGLSILYIVGLTAFYAWRRPPGGSAAP